MKTIEMFSILDRVDSTNNYAMAELHAGMAKHGMAWFAKEQNKGKGQRGKSWLSEPGQNITMSVIIEPPAIFFSLPFVFNMVISNACQAFLSRYCKERVAIKWPNDIYLRDRKAGGILIENIFHGSSWKWAVVGIGININQLEFSGDITNAISLKNITGESYDSIGLARELYQMILESMATIDGATLPGMVKMYNYNLFLVNEKVKLRKKNMVFETTIQGVNEHGQLLTQDSLPRLFEFGEVEWIL